MGEDWKEIEPGVMVPVSIEEKMREQEMKDAPELDFEVSGETWIRIQGSDGADIRFRTIIIGLKRLPDDPVTGKPQYVVASKSHMRVIRKGGEESKSENPDIFRRR